MNLVKKLIYGLGIPLVATLFNLTSPKEISQLTMINGPEYYLNKIEETKTELIDDNYVDAIIETESSKNPFATSKKGARGWMQLMPSTWEQFGEGDFRNAYNPFKNKEAGIKYLEWIRGYCEKFHPEWENLDIEEKRDLISAAYNGGPAKLKSKNWDIQKMYPETRRYIQKVRSNI